MRLVPLNAVIPLSTLGQNLYSENGDILLKRGITLTTALLDRIRTNNIHSLYIDDGYCDAEIQEIIRPEVRQKALRTIKEAFKSIENLQTSPSAHNGTGELQRTLKNRSLLKYADKLKGVCESIVDDIAASKQLMINLVDIKNLSNHQYEHALSVAVMATVLGIELKLDKHQLYCLFMAAVLHDVGKLFLDKKLLETTQNYTLEELAALRTHPRVGFEYLKKQYHFEASTRIVALQHHERYDGAGFPHGTSGDHLHLFSRIVSACNTYDNLTSDSYQRPAVPAHEAFEFLMGNSGAAFDHKVIEVFAKRVNPYPVGTLVKLSNGEIAVVIKDTPSLPLRPTVQGVNLAEKKLLDHQYDLTRVVDLVIVDIVR